MKKILITALLVFMVVMLVVSPVSAQKDKVNLKGEVVSYDSGTLTVQTNKGETFVVIVPDGFDMIDIQIGASVLIKGKTAQDGSIKAESIKLVGKVINDGNDNNDDEKELPEGFKDNSAYCAEGKQVKPHPLASKMAERYGVTEQWVMSRFCEGYSIGAIMLAIKTSQIEGIATTRDDLLSMREAGNGWGSIWKELGLIGSEKSGKSPPGLLKKPDHTERKKSQ